MVDASRRAHVPAHSQRQSVACLDLKAHRGKNLEHQTYKFPVALSDTLSWQRFEMQLFTPKEENGCLGQKFQTCGCGRAI